ncbi:3-methylornithyl-N6-L-lysine dehydrogenase PylD [bacterium 210820-DFI.6.37]|nr:3-methylornithyl-N6-L-lysine dehydrogenase PylD [bacterium 210820-DFI.6.37]
MTRLRDDWISELENTAGLWNEKLCERTGLDFIKIAAAVSGQEDKDIRAASESNTVAVVPITSGQGTISSFAKSVASIVRTMGFKAFVTQTGDVNGIYEAYVKDADILFMADDDRFIALNLRDGSIGDNNIATASGYTEILNKMADGLEGKEVAVLGYGVIGQLMSIFLTEKGAKVAVFDKNVKKKEKVIEAGYKWLETSEALNNYQYIADGTSEGGWLNDEMLHKEALIVAPGIPLSLTETAREKLEGRYIHDLLEIGTVGMLAMAL